MYLSKHNFGNLLLRDAAGLHNAIGKTGQTTKRSKWADDCCLLISAEFWPESQAR